MPRLVDLASVVRSKNAGPLTLTLDLLFRDADGYARALASPELAPGAIAQRYGVAPDKVSVVPYPAAHAVKIAIARKVVAGAPGDRDVYGAQQHALLLDIEL